MPSNTNYIWLFFPGNSSLRHVLPHPDRCLDAVHHRHAEVSQNQSVVEPQFIRFYQLYKCLLTCDAEINLVSSVDLYFLKNYLHAGDAKLLVVSDHDPV